MKKRFLLLIFTFCSLLLSGQEKIDSSKIEEKILNKVKNLKIVKQYEKGILKSGCHVSFMMYPSDEKKRKYLVHIGLNNPDRFITRFLFEVDEKTLKIIQLNK